MRAVRVVIVAVAMVAAATSAARAQGAHAQGIEPEARVDAIVAHRSAVQAALGADIPFSPALHLELAAGAGPSFGGGAGSSFSARGDAIVHFLLDPQHLMRWSPYAGGGVGARYDKAADWRAVAILVVGVNAPRWKHAVPFIEAGLGGGFRIGAGVRRTP
ncbi:MAG: hypothetical protein JWO39_423 [Gemmatimonadetes bacterium]|nr:hypothetical protein [Gemmatimonadota bacterium]